MFRRVLLPAALVLLVLALAGSSFARVAPSQADTLWVSTATQGMSVGHTAPFQLTNATPLGALPGTTRLSITVGLRARNKAALDALYHQFTTPGNPLYGHTLTPDQLRADYDPTSDQAQAVESYLTSQGLTNVQATPDNMLVTADGTTAQIEAAFNTHLEQFQREGRVEYANTTAAQVPAALGDTVLSVLGLTSLGRMSVPLVTRSSATPPATLATSPTQPITGAQLLNDFDPQGFWRAYDVVTQTTGMTPVTPMGDQTNIAIFAEGDLSGVLNDLVTERNAVGLPLVPVTVVTASVATPTDLSGATEFDLDTQFSSGMAGQVKNLLVIDSLSLSDSALTLGFDKFIGLTGPDGNIVKAGSASFGECEIEAQADGALPLDDQAFEMAGALGQTVFASSGDTGAACALVDTNGVPDSGLPQTEYPASSQFAIGVGGTTLLTNSDDSYNTELAWYAGGGGISTLENQPTWQNGIAPPANPAGQGGRAVPDVAMDADPDTGANVYVNGQPEEVGGTSLSSPLALGVWARLESGTGNGSRGINSIPFAGPYLYSAYQTAGFHDVTLGDNGIYPATPGYDLVTGLGSFDVAAMENYIVQTPVTVTPPTLAAPICPVWYDAPNDATPLVSQLAGTGSVDSLDLLAGGFYSDGTALTGVLLLKNLHSGTGGTPALAPGSNGDAWYIIWTYNGTRYFLSAAYPGTSGNIDTTNPVPIPVDYNYGVITTTAAGTTLYQPNGTATGSLNEASNLITITTPLSNVGSPSVGQYLTLTGGATFAEINAGAAASLQQADGAGPGSSYQIGGACAGTSSTIPSTPTPVPTMNTQTPQPTVIFPISVTTPTAMATVVGGTPRPSATGTTMPVPPTATSTSTSIPPAATGTPVPPTATSTPVPPTATHTSAPSAATATATATPVPPTSTSPSGAAAQATATSAAAAPTSASAAGSAPGGGASGTTAQATATPTRTTSTTAGTGAAQHGPSITVSPATAHPGTRVTVHGAGFAPNEQITLALNGAALATRPAVITTSSSGTFTASFVPGSSLLNGANTVSALGNRRGDMASATLSGLLGVAAQFYVAGGVESATEHATVQLLNPTAQRATARLTLYFSNGATVTHLLTLKAHTQRALPVGSLTGRRGPFGLAVTATRPIAAQLDLSRPGEDGDTILGNTGLGTTWYLAEGYTGLTFHESVALLNPNPTGTAQVQLHLLPITSAKVAGQPARTVTVRVPAHSERVVDVTHLLHLRYPSLSIVATSNRPIVVTRTLTFSKRGQGHGSGTGYGLTTRAGTNVAATSWLFAEGTTVNRFQTFLTLLNPGDRPAHITAQFFGSRGGLLARRTLTVAARSRANIVYNRFLHASGIASLVQSSVPIVVERPEYFGSPNGVRIAGSDVFGRNGVAPRWTFPGGRTGKTSSEFLLLYNPSARTLPIDVTLYGSNGHSVTRRVYVAPRTRDTLDVRKVFAGMSGAHGTTLRSVSGQGFVAEQTVFAPNHSTLQSTQGLAQ